MVQLVFEPEIGFRAGDAGGALGVVSCERGDVATCAKGFRAGASDDDYGGELGLLPFLRREGWLVEVSG